MKLTKLILWLAAILAIVFPVQAQTYFYPGPPIVTTAGPLTCKIFRSFPGQIEADCNYLATPTSTPVNVCSTVTSPRSAQAVPVSTSIYCEAQGLTASYIVSWTIMPMFDGTINYQVNWVSIPCAAPTTSGPLVGNCTPTTPITAAQTQRGTLP